MMKNKQPWSQKKINNDKVIHRGDRKGVPLKDKNVHLKDIIKDEDSGDSFSKKLRFFLMKGLFSTLFGLIVMGFGLLTGKLLAHYFGYELPDTLFIIGMLLTIIGIFASMKGNPTSINISGIGMSNVNALNYMELETVRLERERTNYYQDFFKHAVVKFAISGLTFLLGGVFTMIVSILLYK